MGLFEYSRRCLFLEPFSVKKHFPNWLSLSSVNQKCEHLISVPQFFSSFISPFYYLGFLKVMHLRCRKCPESFKCSVLLRQIFNVNFGGSELPVFIALWMLSGNEYVKSLRNKLHTCDLFYYRELKFFCCVSVQLAASLAVPVELPFHMLLI